MFEQTAVITPTKSSLSLPRPAQGLMPNKGDFLFRFNFRGFRWMKTMIHTIKEINERKDILPNHTLGYQIFDSCFTISKVMESSLVFLTGQEENKPNLRNSTGAYLAGIVGSGGSALSIAASKVLGLYYMPQVSENTVLSINL
jgi:vomeronasal 2 receptor